MPNIRYFFDFLRHRLSAFSAHGLHSPFVFKFYENVLHGPSSPVKSVENIRSKLLKDDRVITVADYGAGSQMTGLSQKRRVSEIAQNALKQPRLAAMLSRLAAFAAPDVIIELGTSLGITSAYLALSCPESDVISLEGSPEIARLAREVHLQAGVNVNVMDGVFDELLPQVLSTLSTERFLLYVDGNHQYAPTIRYFEDAVLKAGRHSIIVFDDIYWSKGMKAAWKKIVLDGRVTLSLDIFFMGIVFTDSHRVKQHFKLRF